MGTLSKFVLRSIVSSAVATRLGPCAAVRQSPVGGPLPGDLDEHLERGLRVGHDGVVGREGAAYLRRFDVDVHKGATLGVRVEAPGVAVGPAVTDAEHEIR